MCLHSGSETETPTNSANHGGDNGDELAGICTEDMLDEKGKPFLGSAMMTEDQARRPRERGPSGSGKVPGAGRQTT
jgi:hypothetical protein